MYLLVPVGIVLLFVDGSIETIAEFIGTKSTNIGASLIGAIIGFNLYHTLAYGGNDEYVPEEEEEDRNDDDDFWDDFYNRQFIKPKWARSQPFTDWW